MVLTALSAAVALGLAGCEPGSDADSGAVAADPPEDTGWSLYEAPGVGWRELRPGFPHEYVVEPAGRVLASSCGSDSRGTDGACRLEPFEGVEEPVEDFALYVSVGYLGGGSDVDLVRAGGVAYGSVRRSYGPYEPLPWPDVTEMQSFDRGPDGYSGQPCRCALAGGEALPCIDMEGEPCPGLEGLLDDAVAMDSDGVSLVVLKGDGSAWVASTGVVNRLDGGPYTDARFGATFALTLVTAAGEIETWGVGPDLGGGPPWLHPSPLSRPTGDVYLASGSWGGPVCWVDTSGRVHFDLLDSDFDDQDWARTGPVLPGLPTAILCPYEVDFCALVDERLVCGYRGDLGDPYSYMSFGELMLRSGTQLQ